MDKKKMICMAVVSALMVILIAIEVYKKPNTLINDNKRFKMEYEALNGKYDKERKKDYVKVEIEEENPIVYSNYNEIVDVLKNGTGIIYFGFKECPWCRNAAPVLIDAANELGIEKIYYYDNKDMRDTKVLDKNGNIKIEKKGTKEYKELLNILNDYLPTYEGLNDETIKRLYFPTVVFVKDGKILGLHISTVDSQKDPYKKLTKNQYNELKLIYTEKMNEVFDILCDKSC